MNKSNAIAGREDISNFVVHLTRDDSKTFTNGSAARDNFISILKSKSIYAARAHCLFNKKIDKLPKDIQKKFYVSCFTEVPLSQIHLLTREIEGRSIRLEPYGFVFSKDFIVKQGGQPAIYINSYGGNNRLRKSIDSIFDSSFEDEELVEPNWRILPFINAMHEKCDFSWEREWRFTQDFNFAHSDLICGILPEDGEDELRIKFSKAGIAVISPGATFEQIIFNLATQQRDTKRLVLEGKTVSSKN